MVGYLQQLAERFGQAWNRFWYTAVDPGPLSVLRFLVGALVLASLATYTSELDRFLGPRAVLSIADVVQLQESENSRNQIVQPWRLSYFDYVRTPGQTQILHYLGIGVVALFTLGAFTRVTSVLSLIVFLSYFHRLPMVTLYHERILAFLLFYICLAPAGAYMSIDAWRRRGSRGPAGCGAPPSWSANVALRLIQIHLVVVYLMSGLSKLSAGDGSWWNGSAVWWLVQEPAAAWVDVAVLNGQTFLINAWTHAIVIFELAFVVLIWQPIARPLLVTLGLLVWLSVILATGLVNYGLAMTCASLAFLTSDQLRALGQCCGWRCPGGVCSS